MCSLGEGPFYDAAADQVGWVDVEAGRVLWRDLGTGKRGEIICSGHVSAAIPRRGGGLVLCLRDGPVLRDPDGTIHPIGGYATADLTAGRPPPSAPIRSNDAKADPAGRQWVGTMAYDTTAGARSLYRLDPSADAVEHVVADVTISNGIGWSPNSELMYYVDTSTGRVDVFDYDLTAGAPTRRRIFAAIPKDAGMPDGLCVDAGGGVWVALWGGSTVRRYAPDGMDRVVHVPTAFVTSCAFVGSDRALLVITTACDPAPSGDGAAGLTYVHAPGDVVGVPVAAFAGWHCDHLTARSD